MKRRKFIQSSAVAAASLSMVPGLLQAATDKKPKIGIQLYTLRDAMKNDPKGTLKQVADFGYKELETNGYKDGRLYGMPVGEYDAYIRSLGMKTTSGHYDYEDRLVHDDWEQCATDAKGLGQSYMVVPWLNPQRRNLESIKEVCEKLNKAGEICKKYGLKLQYHNHDFEFKKEGEKLLFDVMLEELDADLVGIELDLYWIIFAGYDPIKYFEKAPGRFEQWHIKDVGKEPPHQTTEVGNGSVDFKAIFAKAKLAGMKHFYVEQDISANPIESVKISINNLKSNIL